MGGGKFRNRPTKSLKLLAGVESGPRFASRSRSTSRAIWLSSLTPVLDDPRSVEHTPCSSKELCISEDHPTQASKSPPNAAVKVVVTLGT